MQVTKRQLEALGAVYSGMTIHIPRLALAGFLTLHCLPAQTLSLISAGHQALYAGRPAEAAADYQAALDAIQGSNASPDKLVHLEVTLATAHLEAGNLHDAEGALAQAQKTSARLEDEPLRAEVLNAWSALHLLQGKWNETETELQQARRIMTRAPQPGDLLPAILHNLAALEMRTGEYQDALRNEHEAMSLWSKVLGPDHPHLIRAWTSLGSLQYLLGRPKEAHVSMERAIASAQKTYGPTYPLVADLLDSDAVVLDRLRQKKQAKLARAQARQIRGGEPAASYARTTWNVRDALAPDSAVYLRSR